MSIGKNYSIAIALLQFCKHDKYVGLDRGFAVQLFCGLPLTKYQTAMF